MYCNFPTCGSALVYGWILSNEKVAHINAITENKYWDKFHRIDKSNDTDYVCGTCLVPRVMCGMAKEVILEDNKVDKAITKVYDIKDEFADDGIYLGVPKVLLVSFE